MNLNETPPDLLIASHILTVVEGRQTGASAVVPHGKSVSVGTAIDNDIVLFSNNRQPFRVQLNASRHAIKMVVVEGYLINGDQILERGGTHSVAESERYEIEGVAFTFRLSANPDSDHASDEIADDVEAKHPGAHQEPLVKPTQLASLNPLENLSRTMTFACLGLGLFFMLIALSVGLFNAADSRVVSQPLQQKLASADFADLNYIEPTDGQRGRITGMVQNSAQKARVNAIVNESALPVDIDLQVNNRLEAAIEDVYRVNGLKADVVVTGLGEIEVWTSTSNTQLLNSVESGLKRDYPGIVSMTVTNAPPVDDIVNEQPAVFNRDPDKRVTLIVAGADGYLMTQDKSRYFIGSTLPSGHVIQSIEDGKVYVQNNGKTVVLEF